MQKCKQCEWEFPDDMQACPYCGHPVEPEDKKQKRRFNLRRRPNLPGGAKQPLPGLRPSQPPPITPSKKSIQLAILVSTIIVALVLTGILLVRANRADQSLTVSPSLLDFGQVKVDSKSVLSVVIMKSSEFPLAWQIDPANIQWLQVALRPKADPSSNLREDIYDVTANTSKLNEGNYSARLLFSSERGNTQQVTVKIQVVKSNRPAKLNVSPLSLDFGSLKGGDQKTLLLTVGNSGGQELRWTADKGKTLWLTLDHYSGKIAAEAIPQSINVMVDTATLTAAQYSTTINFSSNGGKASVTVNLKVTATQTGVTVTPRLTLSPTPTQTITSVPPVRPIVSGITPRSGPVSGGTSIMLSGANLSNTTNVSFGSTTASNFTVDSDIQITVVSPPSGSSGTVDVTVTTAGGTSATSSNDQFTYIPLPVVSHITPTSSAATITKVTITGSGFTGATGVSFGSMPADSFTIDSDTQITAVTTFQVAKTGWKTVDVTVTTAGGTSATNSNDQFTYYIVF